jgi:hypothetical protein
MDGYAASWSLTPGETGWLSAELTTAAAVPTPAPSRKSRKSERVEVEFGAGLRQRGASGVSVQVVDLSTEGFRIATHLQLEEGTEVWLRLPSLEPYPAKVVWSRGHYVGCTFIRPLHPAVLETIVQRSRPR